MLDGQQDLYLCPAAWNTPPVIYTHTHTPRAYPALKRGVRKHGHWGGRGAWRCWPDAGHKKLLMPGTPCVPLGMAGAPSPGDRVGTTAVVATATARCEAGFLSHHCDGSSIHYVPAEA